MNSFSTGFKSAGMLSGIASLGVKCQPARSAPHGRRDRLISMRSVAPGHDQPGIAAGQNRAEDIGPFGALVAGRPRARATSGPRRVSLFFADAGFILPQLYLDAFREPRPDLRQFGGEVFLKASTELVLRVVARPRRDLGEAERLRPIERDGERLQEPPRQVLAPPRRRRPPGPGRPQQPPPVRGGDRR